MELEQLKKELSIDHIKNEAIKTYLIHENIKKLPKRNDVYKTNFFTNLGLNIRLLTSKDYKAIYSEILLKAKNEPELIRLLDKLDKKIITNTNVDKLRNDAVSSLNSSSSFYISLGNTDPAIKFINITLDNNTLFYDFNYSYKELKDEKCINEFKNIVLKYKSELYKYTFKQEKEEKKLLRDLVLKGKMRNSLQGNIDTIKLSIYPELTNEEKALNESYFKFKNDIISFIEQNDSKAIIVKR